MSAAPCIGVRFYKANRAKCSKSARVYMTLCKARACFDGQAQLRDKDAKAVDRPKLGRTHDSNMRGFSFYSRSHG